MGYGCISYASLYETVEQVCNVLGRGINDTAVDMLMETAAAETHAGYLRDSFPYKHGVGLFQHDEIGFIDAKNRSRENDKARIFKEFGVVVDHVLHRDLAYSPLLAAIFCRLFYKLNPEPFPKTREGRAQYWKRNYNTFAGAGSEQGYIEKAEKWLT